MSKPANVPSSTPAPRRRRKWPLLLGGLVAIPVAIVLLMPLITNAFVRPKVVAAMRASLTGETDIERLSYSIFSGLEIAGLRIANPPGFSAGPCVTVERITANPSLLSLLRGEVVLNGSLRVVTPKILIEEDARGRLNFACLANEQKPAAISEKKTAANTAAVAPFVIASLLVEDLGISLKTPSLSQPIALSPLRIETRVDTFDKPVTFAVRNADASLDVKGNALIVSQGSINFDKLKAELDYAITPALLAPLKPVLASFGPVKKFEGTLAGSGRVTLDGLARPAGKGQLTLDVPELAMLIASGGTNVLQTLRPGPTQLSYEFKPRGDRETDLDLNLTSPAASVAFKGVATADAQAPSLDADITATADIAALAERCPGYLATDRKLQGRISGGVKGLKASAKSFAADLDFRGEGLAEIGPSGALAPLVKDLASRLRFNFDIEKKICRIENLDARVDDALQAKGRFTLEQRPSGSVFETDLRLGVDLDALMAKARRFTDMIPPTLPLAGRVDAHVVVPTQTSGETATPLNLHVEVNNLKTTGVSMPYGQADITGAGSASWSKIEINSLAAIARVAPGGAAATETPLEVKVSGRGAADLAAGRYDVPELRVTLPGAGVTGAASVVMPTKAGEPLGTAAVDATVSAAGSIKPLLDLARVWGIKLKGMDGAGNVTAKLETTGTLGQFTVKTLHAEVKDFALSGPKAPTAIAWPQSLAADASLTLNALDPMKSPINISSGSAQVAGLVVTSLKGKLALDPASDKTDLQITGTLDPAALTTAAPGYFKDMTVTSGAGPFDIRLRGALLGAKQDIAARLELPETSVQTAAAGKSAIVLGKPSLDLQAKVDTRSGSYQISRANLKTALAALDARADVALDKEGKLAKLDAQANGDAELAKVRDLVVAMGLLTNTTELAGNMKLTANVTAGEGGFSYTIQASAPGLHFKGPQAGGVVIDEPDLALNLKGLFTNTKDNYAVSVAEGSEVRTRAIQAKLKGVVALDPASDKTDLEIAGQFNPVAVASALPGCFKDITIRSGAGPVSLRLRGALTGAGTEVIAKLDLPETTVQTAAAGKSAIALGKPALDLQAKVDTRSGSYQISRANLKTALAALDARADVALDKKGKLAKLDAHANGDAELAKVRNLVVAMGLLTNTTELAGNLKLAANVTAGQRGFPYTIQVSAPGLHFKGPQAGGVAIDEHDPALSLKGVFKNTKDDYSLSIAEGSELQTRAVNAKLKGTIALDPASDKTDLRVNGTLDPVALTAAAPGYFKDVTVKSGAGPFDIRLRGALLGAKQDITAKLELPETSVQTAAAGKSAIALGKPALDLQAKLDTRNGSYQISRANLKTALATLDARADVALDKEGKLAKLDAHADSAAELAKVRDLVVGMGFLTNTTELAGNMKLAANVTAGQGGFPYTIQASAPGLRFKGPQAGGIAIDEPEPALNLKGVFRNTKDNYSVSVAEGSEVRLRAVEAKLKGTLALDPASDKTDLEIAGQFDPVALASTLPGYFKNISLQSGPGPVSLRLRGSLSGAGTEVIAKLDLPETTVQTVAAGKSAMALGKPSLDLQAKVDTRSSSYQISRANLKTALASLDARADVALDKAAKLAKLDANANGAAELTRLRDLIVAMGLLTNTTELTGNMKLAANVTAGQGGFPYTIQASAPGLHFKGPQTGGVAIDEPEPVLNVKGLFANTKDGFSVSIAEGSELQMQTAKAKLSGTFSKKPNESLYAQNLVADMTYNPPKLKPVLKAFNAGEILATEQQTARLVFTGPVQPGNDIAAWLASLTLQSKMGYQAYSHTGVKVEGDPLAADMRAGKLPLDYAFKINGGSASVKGEMNAQGPESRSKFKVDQLALNVEMAPMLGYLSPLLFAKNGQLEGQASAFFDGTWTGPINMSPLPQSGVTDPSKFTVTDLLTQRLSGRGQLALKNLKITGAPLLNMILKYLGTSTDSQTGEIEPTDFVVEKGCLSYQKMVIKLSGMVITLSGKINFDQTMEMKISLPFPAQIREQNKELAQYLGDSITVPLTGTISSPKMDTGQALQIALKDAASKALKGKGTDMLKGLFNKSDTKAADTKPADAKPGDTKPADTTTPKSDKDTKPSITTSPLLKGLFDKSDRSKK